MYSSLKMAENHIGHFDPGIYFFPANYDDCFGHFIEQKDVDCEWSRDYAKSFFPDFGVNACDIYPEDRVLGCEPNSIRFKKGDIVWCVDTEWHDKIRLGIVYALPYSNVGYEQRLSELRNAFGEDYSFELDIDSYIVFILYKNEENPSYPSGYFEWCATPYVFPVTEKIPNDIKGKLIDLLNYKDAIIINDIEDVLEE